MSPHELKGLLVQLTNARSELAAKRDAVTMAQGQLKAAQVRVAELSGRIADAEKEPAITEHAMLRYIERAHGLDLDELRQFILTPALTKQIKVLGSGKYPIPHGLKAVVKGMTIVSIVEK